MDPTSIHSGPPQFWRGWRDPQTGRRRSPVGGVDRLKSSVCELGLAVKKTEGRGYLEDGGEGGVCLCKKDGNINSAWHWGSQNCIDWGFNFFFDGGEGIIEFCHPQLGLRLGWVPVTVWISQFRGGGSKSLAYLLRAHHRSHPLP